MKKVIESLQNKIEHMKKTKVMFLHMIESNESELAKTKIDLENVEKDIRGLKQAIKCLMTEYKVIKDVKEFVQ